MTNMSTNTNMSTITNTKTPPPASNCPFYRSPTLYPFHIFTKLTENISYLKFLEDFGGGDCTHIIGEGRCTKKGGGKHHVLKFETFLPLYNDVNNEVHSYISQRQLSHGVWSYIRVSPPVHLSLRGILPHSLWPLI